MVYKSSSPTKDGRCWQFRCWYTDPLGNRKQFNSKKYLTKKEAQREEAIFTSGSQANLSDSATLLEIMVLFINSKENIARNNTKRYYNQGLNAWEKYNKVKLCDFAPTTYTSFLKDHERLKPNTINLYIVFLRSALQYFSKVYNVPVYKQLNILQKVANNEPKKLKYYSYQEYQQILKYSSRPELITTLYYCGLRSGEARGLTWNDVDLDNSKIYIRHQVEWEDNNLVFKPLKTQKSERVLPIPPQVKQALESLKMRCRAYTNFNDSWFVFGNAVPFVDQSARNNLYLACKKANVEHLGSHAFRHSCASNLLNQGASMYLVSQYLGHSDVTTTTSIYGHLQPNSLDALMKFFE